MPFLERNNSQTLQNFSILKFLCFSLLFVPTVVFGAVVEIIEYDFNNPSGPFWVQQGLLTYDASGELYRGADRCMGNVPRYLVTYTDGVETDREYTGFRTDQVADSFCPGINQPPPPPPPSGTCAISISPTTHPGGSYVATLNWSTSGDVDQVSVTGVSGASLSGSKTVSGYQTSGEKRYYLNGFVDGKLFCSRTATLNFPAEPLSGTCSLSASPTTVFPSSGVTTLTWSSAGDVGYVSFRGGQGPSGSVVVAVTDDQRFTMYGYDRAGGVQLCQASVNVTVWNPPLTSDPDPDPDPTESPACSNGVDDDGDGLIDDAGGPGGEAADDGCTGPTDDDEQGPPPQPTITVDDADQAINEGESTILRWDTGGHLGTCSITNNIGGNPLLSTTGNETVSPTSDQTYTITCEDTGGDYSGADTVTDSVTLTVQTLSECNDGIDNDGDGRTDHPADTGCSSPADNNEYNPNLSSDNYRPTCTFDLPSAITPGEPFSYSYRTYDGNYNIDVSRLQFARFDASPTANLWGAGTVLNLYSHTGKNTQMGTLTINESSIPTENIRQRADGTEYITLTGLIIYDISPSIENQPAGCGPYEINLPSAPPSLPVEPVVYTPTLELSSTLVKKGSTVTVTWDNDDYPGTCTLNPSEAFIGEDANTSGSSEVTVNSEMIISYSCVDSAAVAAPVSVEKRVFVLPSFFES